MAVTPDGLGRLPDAKKDGVPPWFVDIGEPEPLMTTEELRAAIARGEVPAGTLVWRLGMDNWVPYETLEEVQSKDALGVAAHEPLVTPVVPGEPESDPPRDTHVERTVPFDTDPAPPPNGDSEPSEGQPKARARRARGRERPRPPLDTIPEDGRPVPEAAQAERDHDQQRPLAEEGRDAHGKAPRKHGSLWRLPQASLPPRPSLSVPAAARPALTVSTQPQGSAHAHPAPEPSPAPAGTAESAEPGTATAPDEQPLAPPPAVPTAPELGSASSAVREPQEGYVLLSPTSPGGTRAGMLSDAPTNPRQNALPSEAVVPPETGPDAAALPTPAGALEPDAAAGVDTEKLKAPDHEEDGVQPQESDGARVEPATAVRLKMDALRARYLRLMVAVAVAAAACAAVTTALLMRTTAPVVPHSRAASPEGRPRRVPATPRAASPPVESPTAPVEALPVEALPTEQPPATEAPPEQARAESATALTHTAARLAGDRSGSSVTSDAGASEAARSGDAQRVDSKPARDHQGLDDAGAKPRASAEPQPEPAGKVSAEPASGTSPPTAAPGRNWRTNDPGF
jgi:hypothetical protein